VTWPVAFVLAVLVASAALAYVARMHFTREEDLDREALAHWRKLTEDVERIDNDRERMWLAIRGMKR
jgi:hypothetical protein